MKNRIKQFIFKMLGVKGLFAVIATVALFLGKVPDWMFLTAWGMVIGSRELQKSLSVVLTRGSVQSGPEDAKENE